MLRVYSAFAATVVGVPAVWLLAACASSSSGSASASGECNPLAPGPGLSKVRRDSLPPWVDDAEVSMDARWAQIAREVPGGFAGLYLEPPIEGNRSPQRLIVRLVRPEMRDQVIGTIASRLRATYQVDFETAAAQRARWDWAQLYDWHAYLVPHALKVGDLREADLNEVRNRIEYGVVSDSARTELLRHFEQLGVPCGLVDVRIASGIRRQ
jgi:hypothetical protein